MRISALKILILFNLLNFGCAQNQFPMTAMQGKMGTSELQSADLNNLDNPTQMPNPQTGTLEQSDNADKEVPIKNEKQKQEAEPQSQAIIKTGNIESNDKKSKSENSLSIKKIIPVGQKKINSTEDGYEVVEKGFIKPTIYYHATLDEDKLKCGKNSELTADSGRVLISVCRNTEETCLMEGSCAIIQNGVKRTFNISNKIAGRYRYFETTKDICRYGYGVNSTCLDPFYTLAADPSIYKPGDVIYIPAANGMQLPDNTKHSGYFVVRDQGKKVLGKGRFDFYSGFFHWDNKTNPFSKIGFADITTRLPYFVIKGDLAKKVLIGRGFPKIP
jgi:hypothetical protein